MIELDNKAVSEDEQTSIAMLGFGQALQEAEGNVRNALLQLAEWATSDEASRLDDIYSLGAKVVSKSVVGGKAR